MENEMFTFVTCTSFGHSVEYHYCSRKDADTHFDNLVAQTNPATLYVAYYCATVGGLVNAQYLA